jgi:peptidoglycan/xylan/chitin deacetylase (PgdA/CDA1 family)
MVLACGSDPEPAGDTGGPSSADDGVASAGDDDADDDGGPGGDDDGPPADGTADDGEASGPDPDSGDDGPIPMPDGDVDDPNLVIAPWNGHQGAVSFTFDDGDPTHYDVAGPVLDDRGVKGTFFVVADTVDTLGQGGLDGFGALADNGHEIANHTMTHTGSSQGSASEVSDCEAWIASNFGTPAVTFAYPNVDITDTYKNAAAALYVASRGGGTGDHVTLEGPTDWHDVPSWFISDPDTDPGYLYQVEETIAALDETITAGAWRIITVHGVGPSGFWANTSPENLAAIIDSLEGDDVWIDTFGRVASYLRAQQALDAATPVENADGSRTWTWALPPGFPPDVALRVVVDGGTLTQNGQAIDWNGNEGYYPVDPLALELTWTP